MAESKTPWEQASEWFARTLAIVMVMVAPGALGAWLDQRYDTNFIAAAGFVFGMVLAISMLILFTRIKPIDNDGAIMKRPSSSLAARLTQPVKGQLTHDVKMPSESPLPELPGAERPELPGAERLEEKHRDE